MNLRAPIVHLAVLSENRPASPELPFAPFGVGPDGSHLALWLRSDVDPANAPVVHLDAEQTSGTVLAATFAEFVAGISGTAPREMDEAQPGDPALRALIGRRLPLETMLLAAPVAIAPPATFAAEVDSRPQVPAA